MNTHKNARLTFSRRLEMVQNITQRGLPLPLPQWQRVSACLPFRSGRVAI